MWKFGRLTKITKKRNKRIQESLSLGRRGGKSDKESKDMLERSNFNCEMEKKLRREKESLSKEVITTFQQREVG